MKRWLAAPLQRPDGTLGSGTKGTPQGSAISPLLANLFMHYAFDAWMAREFPASKFERYGDDVVVHCRRRRWPTGCGRRSRIAWPSVGLLLHPDKTRVVYCKDGKRRLG